MILQKEMRYKLSYFIFEQIAMGNIRAIVSLIDGGVPALLHDGSKKIDSTVYGADSFVPSTPS